MLEEKLKEKSYQGGGSDRKRQRRGMGERDSTAQGMLLMPVGTCTW